MTTNQRESFMPRVFISHASDDKKIAEEFTTMFTKKNIKSFDANLDILSGENWEEKLLEEINKSDELLLILSPNSIKSNWVMIEVGAAWTLGKPITPATLYVKLESVPEPIKKFQVVPIEATLAREKLVEDIANRVYSKTKTRSIVKNGAFEGIWHEYNYSTMNGVAIFRHELWKIDINSQNQRRITTKTVSPMISDLKYEGFIEDKGNCLLSTLKGVSHEEYYQVRFPKIIPTGNDVIFVPAIGENFDHNVRFYVLLLSRKELTDEEAREMLRSKPIKYDIDS